MAFSARGKERLIEKSKGLESWKLSVASFLYVHPIVTPVCGRMFPVK